MQEADSTSATTFLSDRSCVRSAHDIMRAKPKTQSFQGLVRERLEDIEHDRARGIPEAMILSGLGFIGTSVGTFRVALYRARRRARSDKSSSQHSQPIGRFAISREVAQRDSISGSRVTSPVAALASSETKAPEASRPAAMPALTTHRDFMARARSTPDKDIF